MRRTALAALGVLAFVLLPAAPAAAHPLGNFTVNRYDGLLVGADGVRVDHVVDFAEIPTVQARRSVDSDRDGTFDKAELGRWAAARCADEAAALELAVKGTRVPLRVGATRARTVQGQAGLLTLRLECQLQGDIRLTSSIADVSFTGAARQQVGWREITVRGDQMTVGSTGQAVRRSSVSNRLTAYPEDLLSSPLDDRSVRFSVRPGGAKASGDAGGDGVLSRPTDRLGAMFTRLVGGADLGLGAAVAAMLLALLIGALHAVAPGHGKTIMAFYLVGRGESRARAARGALTVGVTVTLTHTAGVLILGLVIATAAHANPSSAYPWLGAVSGLVVAAVGLGLLRAAWRRRGATGDPHVHSHGLGRPHSHAPGHDHGAEHDHSHGHAHPHDHDHPHPHPHPDPHDGRHSHHGGDHTHDDGHSHEHDDGDLHPHAVPAARPSVERYPALAGVRSGSTLVASAPARSVQEADTPAEAAARTPNVAESEVADGVVPDRRGRVGLLAVGIAGGLVPSPSALVVLLGAAAVGRAWFGVALVVAFGVGMAITLSATGLLLVIAQDKVNQMRTPRWFPSGRVQGVFPILSALAVCVLGVFLIVRALSALQ